MSIQIKDISGTYVTLNGGLAHRATLEQPEEYHEVEKTLAEALNVNNVYLISYGQHFVGVTDEYSGDCEKEIKALIAGQTLTPEQLAEISDYLEAEGASSEDSVVESLTEDAQNKYDRADYYAD